MNNGSSPFLASWESFGEWLQSCWLDSRNDSWISEQVASKSVLWHGVLHNLDIVEDQPTAQIRLSKISISYSENKSVTKSGIVVPVLKTDVPAWQTKLGSESLQFIATFASKSEIFPPVRLVVGQRGDSMLYLNFDSASLVSDVP